MFSGIKKLFKERADRQRRSDLDEQIENAAQLRDMLGVARKLQLPVVVIVEVQGVRQALCLPGEGKECEWLYNMAAGSFMGLHAERAIKEKYAWPTTLGLREGLLGKGEISASEGP